MYFTKKTQYILISLALHAFLSLGQNNLFEFIPAAPNQVIIESVLIQQVLDNDLSANNNNNNNNNNFNLLGNIQLDTALQTYSTNKKIDVADLVGSKYLIVSSSFSQGISFVKKWFVFASYLLRGAFWHLFFLI